MSSIALELVRHRRGAPVDLPFGQLDVFAALCHAVADLGCESTTHRQMNALAAAADLIYDALAHADVPATPGMGLRAWFESDETGLSSRYLACVLARDTAWDRTAGYPVAERHHPHDAGDFGRCVKMIDAQPELRANLARLAEPEHGPVWNAIGARGWPDLEALYRADKLADLTAELKALAARAVAA